MRKNKNKKDKVRKRKLKNFFINKKIKLFLGYVKTMFIKFFTRKYSIGIIDVLILLVIAGIVSSTTTGYIMNKEYRKNNVGVNGVVYGDSLEKFISIYNEVLTKYYEEVDSSDLIEAGIKGMIEFLEDEYSIYIGDSVTSLNLESTYEGIGIVTIENVVHEVYEGSSAYEEGVKVGDIVVSVNGYPINSDNYYELSEKLKENDGINEIGVLRDGEELLFKVSVGTIVVPTVSSKFYNLKNNSIGYISISSFSKNTYNEFEKELGKLEEKEISGLIVDLRNNGGGYVDAAFDIASDFLEKDKVVYSLKNKNQKKDVLDSNDKFKQYKVIILVNKSTASSAEILAAALKDSYGAIIVGNKTYGKGSVQTVKEYDNAVVKYTSALWLRPNGECVDGVGIIPDYEVDNVIKNNVLNDNQLDKVLQLFN